MGSSMLKVKPSTKLVGAAQVQGSHVPKLAGGRHAKLVHHLEAYGMITQKSADSQTQLGQRWALGVVLCYCSYLTNVI